MSERQGARPLDRIAPDDLVEQVDGAENLDDAISYLHRFGESTTPREQRLRCPVDGCGTVRIGPATGLPEQRTDGEEYEYRCHHGHRFDTPAPPLAEVDE